MEALSMFKRKIQPVSQAINHCIINQGTKVTGTLDCQNMLIVAGEFDGQIKTKQLEVAQSGVIKGVVIAESVVVAGIVEATLKCTGRLKITSTGRVTGDVEYGSLEVSLGGKSNGSIEQTETLRVVPSAIKPSPSL